MVAAAQDHGRGAMRRFTVSLSLALVVLLGVVAGGMSTRAQDATPAAESFEFAPGIMGYPLAYAEGQDIPALYRVTFAPGTVLAGGPVDPTIGLVLIEAGTVHATVAAPVAITPGGGAGTPEIVATGTE